MATDVGPSQGQDKVVAVGPNEGHAVIGSLVKGRLYAAKVRCVTSAGKGPYSPLIYEGGCELCQVVRNHLNECPFACVNLCVCLCSCRCNGYESDREHRRNCRGNNCPHSCPYRDRFGTDAGRGVPVQAPEGEEETSILFPSRLRCAVSICEPCLCWCWCGIHTAPHLFFLLCGSHP